MREHYSTVALDEKRSAMTNVLQLVRSGVAEPARGAAESGRVAAESEAEAEFGGVVEADGICPAKSADNGADGAQIQQRPVGREGSNRA
jgi:hypothetical protein